MTRSLQASVIKAWGGLRNLPCAYLLTLGGLSFYYLIRWPIAAGDTDLWYHLTGGRYLLTQHAIPHDSFFSFISPPREWVDHFWLFQALVYLVYSWLGYDGLVLFRTVIYFATLTLVFRFLFDGKTREPLEAWWAFLVVLCGSVLMSRYWLVRPHVVELCLIAAFLYVLECKPHRAISLPILAVLWVNFHGISYPLVLLISGAYVLEAILSRSPDLSPIRKTPSFLVPVIGSMFAVLLTPHGLRLLSRAFVSTTQASEYIRELSPLDLQDMLSVHLSTMTPSLHTLFNVFVAIACLAGFAAFSKRPLRISHWLLCLGGVALLAKGFRFIYEFMLLALPLIKANPPFPAGLFSGKISRPVYLACLFLTMLIPMWFVVVTLTIRPAYPFSHRNLPHGVATVLNRWKAGGAVLNFPDDGGYLQWMLYPRYRIFMDMEVPFLFTDDDMYLAAQAFSDPEVLGKVLARYEPSFIAAPISFKDFSSVMKRFPAYVLVFFDDVEALYVNQARYPDLASQYQLRALNPFAMWDQPVEAILKDVEGRGTIMREVRQLLELYPDGIVVNVLAAFVHKQDRAYDRMLPHADAIVRNFPELLAGYQLRGDAYAGLQAFDRAIRAYLAAAERSSASENVRLYKAIGLAFFEQRRYEQAYRALNQSIWVYSAKTTVEDLYHLGFSAMMAGRTREAKRILAYLRDYKLAPDDPEWSEKVAGALTRLGVQSSDVQKSDESQRRATPGGPHESP